MIKLMLKNGVVVSADIVSALQTAAERMEVPEVGSLIDAAVWAFYRQQPACRNRIVSDYVFDSD